MASRRQLASALRKLWCALPAFDWVLLALACACVALSWSAAPGGFSALGRLLAYVLGFWFAVRLLRRRLRQILWRLRNRLLAAYLFIALVPIVLIAVLAWLLAYVLVGQVAVYMVISELERRTALLISTAEWLAEDGSEAQRRALELSYPLLSKRLPGLEVFVQGRTVWKHPAEARIEPPPEGWGDAGGLAVKEGMLYAWAHIIKSGATVTAWMPLTSRLLASLAPNTGEIRFLRLQDDRTQLSRPLRLHRTDEQQDLGAPRNRLPDPENRFDAEVRWVMALPAFVWETPGRVENELMQVRTRPSAVFHTLMAQKSDVAQGAIPALLLTLSAGFFVVEVVAMVIGISLTRTITGAVHELYEGTERVNAGDFSHRIPIRGKDQLAALSASFNSMTASVERLLAVAKENERLRTELEIAREVQSQLYPRTAPSLRTLRLTAALNPARMVSGDYYDYQRIDDFSLAVAIGDVAGKGISAALLMATVQSALRTEIRRLIEARAAGGPPISTSFLVSQLNQHLYAHTTPEKYATFCLGIYDERQGVFTYTNAGHLPPILLRNGISKTLEVTGTVVGAFPFARYGESSIALEPGDLLFFYTDGITEPENPYGEQFGEARLLEVLSKSRGQSLEDILSIIIQTVQEWTGTPELQDDMTMLLVRRI